MTRSAALMECLLYQWTAVDYQVCTRYDTDTKDIYDPAVLEVCHCQLCRVSAENASVVKILHP